MSKPKHKLLLALSAALGCFVLLIFLCRLYWLQPLRVAGQSMHPTIAVGDVLIVNKLSYLRSDPKRGDVIFIPAINLSQEQARLYKLWIKRIVGIPGDRISIHPPYIHINGEPLKSPEIFQTISEKKNGYHGYNLPDISKYPNLILKEPADEITLAENEYFVIGDNTTNSFDSRHCGTVPRSDIMGKVVYIAAPADRRGFVEQISAIETNNTVDKATKCSLNGPRADLTTAILYKNRR